jgi:hypothetical protein
MILCWEKKIITGEGEGEGEGESDLAKNRQFCVNDF